MKRAAARSQRVGAPRVSLGPPRPGTALARVTLGDRWQTWATRLRSRYTPRPGRFVRPEVIFHRWPALRTIWQRQQLNHWSFAPRIAVTVAPVGSSIILVQQPTPARAIASESASRVAMRWLWQQARQESAARGALEVALAPPAGVAASSGGAATAVMPGLGMPRPTVNPAFAPITATATLARSAAITPIMAAPHREWRRHGPLAVSADAARRSPAGAPPAIATLVIERSLIAPGPTSLPASSPSQIREPARLIAGQPTVADSGRHALPGQVLRLAPRHRPATVEPSLAAARRIAEGRLRTELRGQQPSLDHHATRAVSESRRDDRQWSHALASYAAPGGPLGHQPAGANIIGTGHPAVDVERLADQVLRQIDHRVTALRERHGRLASF
jgi:hypothetical protein